MLRLKSDLLPALRRHRRRRAQDLRPALARRCGAHRRHGGQGLSRRLRQGHARSAASMRRAPWRASRSSTPARAREGDRAARHRRPRAQRHGARQDRAPRRSSAPIAAIAKIDWPGGFCRTDIGWRAHRAGEGAAHERVARPVSRLRRAAHQDRAGVEIFLRTGGAGPAAAAAARLSADARRAGTRSRPSWPATARW